MTTRSEWQERVGHSWAEMYRQTDRSFSAMTQQLLDRIAALPGDAVLDIGCGAGELSLALARARPAARVVGIDVSEELVEAARARGGNHDNARFDVADASAWQGADFAPDLLVSRHGVMFFDDPVAAFANLRAGAADGAAMLFSCFRAPGENPWLGGLSRLLPANPATPPAGRDAPGPFAFADPERVRGILEAAGWQAVSFEAIDYPYVAGAGDDPVEDALAFFSRIGPAAAVLAGLEGIEKVEVRAAIRRWLEEHRSGNLVAFPAAAWFVSARNG